MNWFLVDYLRTILHFQLLLGKKSRMTDGWFKVHRGWMDNTVFKDDKERICWLWLIERAAWADTNHFVCGAMHSVPRGSLFVTYREISKRFGWSLTKVQNFLLRLQNEDMIQYDKRTKKGHITICNYDRYQQTKDNIQNNKETKTGTLNKKVRNKEENSVCPSVSENDLPWVSFRDSYQSIPKSNWSSKDETILSWLTKSIQKDGEEVVLNGTAEYARLCRQQNRPAYNPVKFLRERKYLQPKASAGVKEERADFRMFQ